MTPLTITDPNAFVLGRSKVNRFKKIGKTERKIKEKEEKILWELCNTRTSNVTLEFAHKRSKGSEAPTKG